MPVGNVRQYHGLLKGYGVPRQRQKQNRPACWASRARRRAHRARPPSTAPDLRHHPQETHKLEGRRSRARRSGGLIDAITDDEIRAAYQAGGGGGVLRARERRGVAGLIKLAAGGFFDGKA